MNCMLVPKTIQESSRLLTPPTSCVTQPLAAYVCTWWFWSRRGHSHQWSSNEVVVTVEIVTLLLVVPTDTEELVTSGSAMEKLVLHKLAVQQQKYEPPVERWGAMHSVQLCVRSILLQKTLSQYS